MEATSSALVNTFRHCILRGCFLPMNFSREVVLLGTRDQMCTRKEVAQGDDQEEHFAEEGTPEHGALWEE